MKITNDNIRDLIAEYVKNPTQLPHISYWDVSKVTDMSKLFCPSKYTKYGPQTEERIATFNEPLNGWVVDNVTNMNGMFMHATAFNQPLDQWNPTKVDNFSYMFCGAKSFNSKLWIYVYVPTAISFMCTMEAMFMEAVKFDQPLNDWDVSNVNNMNAMFMEAITFDQPLNQWDVSNVVDMQNMFYLTTYFNQDLDLWTPNKVTTFTSMFCGAESFNGKMWRYQPAALPEVACDMEAMFQDAAEFNQPIKGWDMSHVVNMKDMFEGAIQFKQVFDEQWVKTVSQKANMTNMLKGTSVTSVAKWYDYKKWEKGGEEEDEEEEEEKEKRRSNKKWEEKEEAKDERRRRRNKKWEEKEEAKDEKRRRELEVYVEEEEYVEKELEAHEIDIALKTITTGNIKDLIVAFFNHPDWFSGGKHISKWDVSKVTYMAYLFCTDVYADRIDQNKLQNLKNFNSPLNEWKVERVNNMNHMFQGATAFNQPLDKWIVENVEKMMNMFQGATAFNQPLDMWTIENVQNMSNMFNGADSFQQNLDNWKVDANKVCLKNMFTRKTAFTPPVWYDKSRWEIPVLTSENIIPTLDKINNTSIRQLIVAYFNHPEWFFNDERSISNWNVSEVTDMSDLFHAYAYEGEVNEYNIETFNKPLKWDVGKVTNMSQMFRGAYMFNQSLANWNVNKVKDFTDMFNHAVDFNGEMWQLEPIDGDDEEPIMLTGMFSNTKSFNQPLNQWNTSTVMRTNGMFMDAKAFNQDISGWNVSMVENMSSMFSGATSFNQPLTKWQVQNVATMEDMFLEASAFNQSLDLWEPKRVTRFSNMFSGATSFNAPLWKYEPGTKLNSSMNAMFMEAAAFNQPLDHWDVQYVKNMSYMFCSAISFNQPLDMWDTGQVNNMTSMFEDAKIFNQDLDSWTMPTIASNMFKNCPAGILNQLDPNPPSAVMDQFLTEGQSILAQQMGPNITQRILRDLPTTTHYPDSYRSIPGSIFPDYLLPREDGLCKHPYSPSAYLVHYEPDPDPNKKDNLWPIVIMPKGMCLFSARSRNVDENYLDADAFYLYKLFGNPTLNDHRGNDSQDTQTYFYPHPHGILNLHLPLYSDTMVVLTRDIRLLCLISPSSVTRRNASDDANQRANTTVSDIDQCSTKSYDICMTDKFRMAMKLDGMIQIASIDTVSKFITDPHNGKTTNISRCSAMNNDLNRAINWASNKLRRKQVEKFLGQHDMYNSNFDDRDKARVFGTPEIVLLPFDSFQDPPDKAAEKYKDCFEAFEQKVNGPNGLVTGRELIDYYRDRFIFQTVSVVNADTSLNTIMGRENLNDKMIQYLIDQAQYLWKSKQYFPIMTLLKSEVDPSYQKDFCVEFTTTSLPADQLYFMNSYMNDGNPKKYRCAFETNYTKEVVAELLKSSSSSSLHFQQAGRSGATRKKYRGSDLSFFGQYFNIPDKNKIKPKKRLYATRKKYGGRVAAAHEVNSFDLLPPGNHTNSKHTQKNHISGVVLPPAPPLEDNRKTLKTIQKPSIDFMNTKYQKTKSFYRGKVNYTEVFGLPIFHAYQNSNLYKKQNKKRFKK
jgi:hypothetical protein